MPHLGLAVYFWGRTPQNRLLVECLGPLASELRSEGLAESFWFDRFDSRGPHVFSVFTLPSAAWPEVSKRVEDRVERYLADHPSHDEMTDDQVAAHHAGCRGKVQCEADALPGYGANNTFHRFEHPAQGYPYWLLAGHPREQEILGLLGELALWSIDQIGDHPAAIPTVPALRWLAALDRELAAAGRQPAEYWRYHATTLILPLAERLAKDEDEALRALPSSVGEKNRALFSRFWEEAETATNPWPLLQRLAGLAAPEPAGPGTPRERWGLLREIVHITLKQLGVPVNLHIPMLLFAWNRNLSAPALEPA